MLLTTRDTNVSRALIANKALLVPMRRLEPPANTITLIGCTPYGPLSCVETVAQSGMVRKLLQHLPRERWQTAKAGVVGRPLLPEVVTGSRVKGCFALSGWQE